MKNLTNYELTMRIYDTLFGNKDYEQFDSNDSELHMSEVDGNIGSIEFYIGERHFFLNLTEEFD